MRFFVLTILLPNLVACAYGLGVETAKPTLYIAGDSTAAVDDGNPALLGWGAKIGEYLDIPVVNDAVSGSTARSFSEQGYCAYASRHPRITITDATRIDLVADIIDAVRPRDIVVIEFGHNDNQTFADSPSTADCPGASLATTCDVYGIT